MANPGDFAYTLKQQADILRIIGDYVKLKKAGAQNYSGLCPFHNEKTPSFSVHGARQFFHCFGCGASGDVFSFIQKIENITFPEAVRAIAQRLNIALPKTTYDSPAAAAQAKLRTALLEIQERACDFFQEYLRRPEGAHARQYLAGRGLNEEMIQAFRIGYAPDSGFLLRDRVKGVFPEEVLRESGVFSWKDGRQPSAVPAQEHEIPRLARNDDGLAARDESGETGEPSTRAPRAGTLAKDDKQARGVGSGAAANGQRPMARAIYSKFRNRVMFPITNESGKIIAFTGRTLSTDEKAGPKYLNSPETAIYSKSKVLFNLDHARQAIRELDYAILVEGQMDAISLYAAGFHNVIASSGTAFTELQAKLLGRFSRNVVVNFDPDTAGAKATERTLSLLVEEEFQIKVVTLEPGLDPDLFVRRKGKEAYTEALRNSQPYFDYLIERARAQFPVRSAEGKVKAVNYLLPHIQRVPSRIARDELAREIAHKLRIDSAVLRQELKHAATSRSSAAIKAPAEAQATEAEKILIRALASPTEIQSSVEHFSAGEGAEEDFDPAHRAQFALSGARLHQGLATEQLIDVLLGASPGTNVMDVPMPEADRNLLAAILMKEEEELTPERVESAVRALERIQIRRKLDDIQRELQSRRSDSARLQLLLEEKVRLKRALMDPVLASQETSA
jgi:DNA primase